jgi:glycosyltransferase involved in cell wall biosynthesis
LSAPTVSVVVPTRDRRSAVTRLLKALAVEYSAGVQMEVIVVDDGSTDGTVASLISAQWPYRLRIVQGGGAGAAVARNAGARLATGDILLFLDDDVEPESGLVSAHAAAHMQGDGLVAIGDLPPVIRDPTLLGSTLRAWWGEMQSGIRRPGHRHTYRDLLSGHFSVRRIQFERLGGFDERLRCREDYELGYRAMAAGLQFQFVPQAVARHHDPTDVAKALRRKRDEGVADVYLLRRHPAIAPTLPLSKPWSYSRRERLLIALAWRNRTAGDAMARGLAATLGPLQAVKLRWRWVASLETLLTYHYWRSVALTVGSPAALQALLARAETAPQVPIPIDLSQGLEAAAAALDSVRPRAARFVLGAELVGDVADVPGEEPLRGVHLRPLLGTILRDSYLLALARTGRVPATLAPAAAPMISAADQKGGRGATAA